MSSMAEGAELTEFSTIGGWFSLRLGYGQQGTDNATRFDMAVMLRCC